MVKRSGRIQDWLSSKCGGTGEQRLKADSQVRGLYTWVDGGGVYEPKILNQKEAGLRYWGFGRKLATFQIVLDILLGILLGSLIDGSEYQKNNEH